MNEGEYFAILPDNEDWEILDLPSCVVAIRDGMVNLDDLMAMRPGGIIRCFDDPRTCIKILRGMK